MRQEGGSKDSLLRSPPRTGPSPTCCLQPFANKAFGGLAALGLSEPGAREAEEEWSPPGGLRREARLEHPCLPSRVRTGWRVAVVGLVGSALGSAAAAAACPRSSALQTRGASFVGVQGGLCPRLSGSLVRLPSGSEAMRG